MLEIYLEDSGARTFWKYEILQKKQRERTNFILHLNNIESQICFQMYVFVSKIGNYQYYKFIYVIAA